MGQDEDFEEAREKASKLGATKVRSKNFRLMNRYNLIKCHVIVYNHVNIYWFNVLFKLTI